MATRHIASVEALAAVLADAVSDHPDVRELWGALRTGAPWFWLVTAAVDPETERELYRAATAIFDAVDDALFDVHIVNPEMYVAGTDPRSIIPTDAHLIATFRG